MPKQKNAADPAAPGVSYEYCLLPASIQSKLYCNPAAQDKSHALFCARNFTSAAAPTAFPCVIVDRFKQSSKDRERDVATVFLVDSSGKLDKGAHINNFQFLKYHCDITSLTKKDLDSTAIISDLMNDTQRAGSVDIRKDIAENIGDNPHLVIGAAEKNRDMLERFSMISGEEKWEILKNILTAFCREMADAENAVGDRNSRGEEGRSKSRDAKDGKGRRRHGDDKKSCCHPVPKNDIARLKRCIEGLLGKKGPADDFHYNLSLALTLLLFAALLRDKAGVVLDAAEGDLLKRYKEKENPAAVHGTKVFLMPENPVLFENRRVLEGRIGTAFENDRIVFLCGMGGSGKTELAKEFARNSYFQTIVWKHCPENDILFSDLALDLFPFAASSPYHLKSLPGTDISGDDISRWDDTVLLIVDNFNDYEVQRAFCRELKKGTGRARILVTTTYSGIIRDGCQIFLDRDLPEEEIASACRIYAGNFSYAKSGYAEHGVKKESSVNEKAAVRALLRLINYNIESLIIIARSLGEAKWRDPDTTYTLKSFIENLEEDIQPHENASSYLPVRLLPDMLHRIEKNGTCIPRALSALWEHDILHLAAKKGSGANHDGASLCVQYLAVLSMFPSEELSAEFIAAMLGDNDHQYLAGDTAAWLSARGWIFLDQKNDTVKVASLIAYIFRKYLIPGTFLGDRREMLSFSAHLIENLLVDYEKLSRRWNHFYHKFVDILGFGFKVLSARPKLLADKEYGTIFTLFLLYFYFPLQNFIGEAFNDKYLKMVRGLTFHGAVSGCAVIAAVCPTGVRFVRYDFGSTDVTPLLDLKMRGVCGRYFRMPDLSDVPLHTAPSFTDAKIFAFFAPDGRRIPDISAQVIKAPGKSTGNLDIPDQICGAPVTDIGPFAGMRIRDFYGGIRIGANIRHIGPHAFEKCSFTGPLVLPEGLREITGYAFFGCSGLTGVLSLPASLEIIGQHAFDGCTGLDLQDAARTLQKNEKIARGLACLGDTGETAAGEPEKEWADFKLAKKITDLVAARWSESGFPLYFPDKLHRLASQSMALINWIWKAVFQTNLYAPECRVTRRLLRRDPKKENRVNWYDFLRGDGAESMAKCGDILWLHTAEESLINVMILHFNEAYIWLTAGMEVGGKGKILWNCAKLAYEDERLALYFRDSQAQLYLLPAEIRRLG